MWSHHHPFCGAIGLPDEHRTQQPHCLTSLQLCYAERAFVSSLAPAASHIVRQGVAAPPHPPPKPTLCAPLRHPSADPFACSPLRTSPS